MSERVEIYFDEAGRVTGVHVLLNLNGQETWIEFEGNDAVLLATYPEDAGTVDDDYTSIDHVILPENPRV